MSNEIADLTAVINRFRDDRDWRQFHNAKDLALSIVLEASELLEIFQWKTAEEGCADEQALREELADVMIYCLMLADDAGLDVAEIINQKLELNARKYPVDASRGSREKRRLPD